MSRYAHASEDQERAGWTNTRDLFFIHLLIEQNAYGKKNEAGCTKSAWKSVCYTFNKKFSLNYTVLQLKSRFKRFKTQYGMVKKILSQEGFRWDESAKVVTADEEVWERYIAERSIARNYKNKCFPLYDDCAALFDGKEVEGQVPSTIHSYLALEDGNKDIPHLEGTPSYDEAENGDEYDQSSEDVHPVDVTISQNKRKGTMLSTQPITKRPRISPAYRIAAAIECISSEFATDCRSVQKLGTNEEVPYRWCIMELQNLKGLRPEECVKAAVILKEPLNRVAFTTFSEDLRLRWLRNELLHHKQL